MGMAASQARYLGLTARKTNVEYEGQQINQARTALSNQSAELFNQLLGLEVPTAPSTTDYTTVQYSYTAGTTEEAIESMTPNTDYDSDQYNYIVTHYHYSDVYKGQSYKVSNPQVSKTEDASTGITTYKVGNSTASCFGDVEETDENYTTLKAALDQILKDQPDSLVAQEYDIATDDTKTEEEQTKAKENIYYYTSNGRTYFAIKDGENLSTTTESPVDGSLEYSIAHPAKPEVPLENQAALMSCYAETTSEKVSSTDKAKVEIGSDGRATSIQYANDSQVYTLNAETVTDENAYNDAMNQYKYNVAQYEKTIQDINAKTEIIQQEDRTLELRLKQLDTEQEALQTEMEAVKKVIDKNIETSFKTFE